MCVLAGCPDVGVVECLLHQLDIAGFDEFCKIGVGVHPARALRPAAHDNIFQGARADVPVERLNGAPQRG
jgi:hypothetical protein